MQIPVIKLGLVDIQNKSVLLSLREGQIVKAFVQSKEGSNLVLNVGDLKILAQTDLEVGVGQPLWLEALEVKPEQLVFKLLAKGHENVELSKAPEDIFTKLNLEPSPATGKAIEVLMSYGLPISKELVEELISNLQDYLLLENIETLIHTLVLLKNKKLPITREAQQLLLRFFLGKAEPEELALALKLFNQGNIEDIELPNLYLMWWQNEQQQGEIYLWNEPAKSRGKVKAYTAVVIHFYTQNLGELWVKLSQAADKLNVDLTSENQEGIKLFNKHLLTLEALLATAGYNLGNISYSTRKVESVFALEEKNVRYKGIDTKV